jgi:hypothetical protein
MAATEALKSRQLKIMFVILCAGVVEILIWAEMIALLDLSNERE